MPDVFFDEDEATRLLSTVIDQTAVQSDAHGSDVPVFPQASAGRDFGGHGAQIQALLNRLHERGAWRLNNMSATADATRAQLHAFGDVDRGLAGHLGAQTSGVN
ncbi:hypothetical protein I6J72_09095 [Corynebacterium sp. FDAARGOS 1242]|uniref:hypothetical protein n=1 Tax=Corynebacterium sp. FDAARGOS 1242 TaxID=2778078 RepID=UPI001952536C|nr:hypothetical protein [Corynebacterium sp. FDAARGOS 1242]QRP97329.1 hypothetical protein I6J72_09095 [Corynebacterium sp. FDAARGOS 1242]